jgi:hypothetical protein
MTETNRIDAIVDTAAGATKFLTKGYVNAFFSEEANERYQRIGKGIGNAIGETLERFELDDHARSFLGRFQSDDQETEMAEAED